MPRGRVFGAAEVAQAQNDLGDMYLNGQGVGQDDAQAVLWYTKAAAQGLAQAQNAPGNIYSNGRGIMRSDGGPLVPLAALQGEPNAENFLGVMIQHGRGGLARSDVDAVRLYLKAAQKGEPWSEHNLGFGLAHSDAEAAVWYRKSALQGNVSAHLSLAKLYAASQ